MGGWGEGGGWGVKRRRAGKERGRLEKDEPFRQHANSPHTKTGESSTDGRSAAIATAAASFRPTISQYIVDVSRFTSL